MQNLPEILHENGAKMAKFVRFKCVEDSEHADLWATCPTYR